MDVHFDRKPLTRVKKVKMMILIKIIKKWPSSRSTKSLRNGNPKIHVKSERVLLVVCEKIKNETDATFFIRVSGFRIKILSLFALGVKSESYSAF